MGSMPGHAAAGAAWDFVPRNLSFAAQQVVSITARRRRSLVHEETQEDVVADVAEFDVISLGHTGHELAIAGGLGVMRGGFFRSGHDDSLQAERHEELTPFEAQVFDRRDFRVFEGASSNGRVFLQMRHFDGKHDLGDGFENGRRFG